MPPGDDGGALRLVGSGLECTNMSWMSIAELRKIAEEQLGIDPEDWPFYGEVEFEEEMPLDDVRAKCQVLRMRLSALPPEALPANRWLRDFARLLAEGEDFCAKAW